MAGDGKTQAGQQARRRLDRVIRDLPEELPPDAGRVAFEV